MATPPPPNTFYLPPIPQLNLNNAGRSSYHQRLSSSFSRGPEGLMESLGLGLGMGMDNGDDEDTSGIGGANNSSLLPSSPRMPRHLTKKPSRLSHSNTSIVVKPSRLRHQTDTNDDTDMFSSGDEMEGEQDEVYGRVERMRLWRHDAMMQHLYSTAEFWGEKVLWWTGDPNDAFWLSQIHFLTQSYTRAIAILTSPLPLSHQPSSSSSAKGKGKARAVRGMDDRDDEVTIEDMFPSGPAGQEDIEEGSGKKLVDLSVACRYLVAQCYVKLGQYTDALEMLGESNPFKGTTRSGSTVRNQDGGIKLEASMCHLRGLIHLRLSSTSKAKESFLEALSLDVKCYDSFLELVGGEMMTVEEEWEFITNALCYKEQLHTAEDAEFVKLIYMMRLKKFKHHKELTNARKRLELEYALGDNPDVLYGVADSLYSQYKWEDCYALTSRILKKIPGHPATLPLHLACMHHLPHLNSSLFLLAHSLADTSPDSPISWYAVGLWYFTGRRYSDSRRYFGKCSLMDPRFGPSWIAFAHSFAMEGEHDQAITAYSTAVRYFQGSHMPLMFIGMEHLQLNNSPVAGEHLQASLDMCDSDPLLWNELGAVAYENQDYQKAIECFSKALEHAHSVQGLPSTWAPSHLNLGQSLRKLGRLEDAVASYKNALELDPMCAFAYTGLGMVAQQQGNCYDAIEYYHEALSINPQSPLVTQLLGFALDTVVDRGPLGIKGLPDSMTSSSFDPFKTISRTTGIPTTAAAVSMSLDQTEDAESMDLSFTV